jgi:hypothetical protein
MRGWFATQKIKKQEVFVSKLIVKELESAINVVSENF